MIVYLNGHYVEDSEASVSIFDRGLAFGDGLYETLRAYKGQVFGLADHLDRLRVGCAMLRMRQRTSESYWRPIIDNLILQNGLADSDSRIRITISRGTGLSLYSLPQSLPTEIMFVVPLRLDLIQQRQTRGVRTRIATSRRQPNETLHKLKTTNLVGTVYAYFECWDDHAEEAIFLNTRDEVCEATTSNVFVVQGEEIFTPPVNSPCLPGVTRKHVMWLAEQLGYKVIERPIPVLDLLAADEVFTCSSISEIVPVCELQAKKLLVPGPITSALQQRWRDYALHAAK